jgi:hypothetical protein
VAACNSVNKTIPNNQNETPSDVTNGVAIAANTLVHLTNSGEHSEYEEPGLLEQRMVEDENITSKSTESCKQWKATPAINDAKERKDDDETEDIDDSSQCNLVQGRRRQLQILPNTGRYELKKRYQLVKRLMVRGVATTYYTRCINALENCACLYIWCSALHNEMGPGGPPYAPPYVRRVRIYAHGTFCYTPRPIYPFFVTHPPGVRKLGQPFLLAFFFSSK